MARIELMIVADSAEDLNDTLLDLAQLRSAGGTVDRLLGAMAGAEPDVGAMQDAEPGEQSRRPRRTKAQIAADAAAAQSSGAASSASESGTEAGIAGTGATTSAKAADPFGDQIKEVVAASKAQAAGATKEDVQAAMYAYSQAHGMVDVQKILSEGFTGADGQPLKRISLMAESDYAAVVAALAL